MKKIVIFLLLVFVPVLFCAACSNTDGSEPSGDTASEPTASESESEFEFPPFPFGDSEVELPIDFFDE